ncbi:MAG: DUF87 domain-containing protein [Chitinophagales bacterium]
MSSIKSKIKDKVSIDILAQGRIQENFVGRPFYIDYKQVKLMTCDAWKYSVKGIPQGAFLLAFYDGESNVEEALLLRALNPSILPTDNDNIRSMVAYYKDNMNIAGRAGVNGSKGNLDDFTRYEFSFSGLECRILGVFYKVPIKDEDDKIIGYKTEFGADVENFYSANNYKVYKGTDEVLKAIVNQRDKENAIIGSNSEFKIGKVRYSSSRRFQNLTSDVAVYVSPNDFLGKRTALFGMTRTGKSNTIKKIIEATVEISTSATKNLPDETTPNEGLFKVENNLAMFDDEGTPKYPVGQIIFDVNGEYANANMQDDGTAIFELYKDDVIRYSVIQKTGFKVMKTNFYNDILAGVEFIKTELQNDGAGFVKDFLSVDFTSLSTYSSQSEKIRHERKIAAYLCCLKKANFKVPSKFKVKFTGHKELNLLVNKEKAIDPSKGISLDEAISWFLAIWENYSTHKFFSDYKSKKLKEWADNDLKALLVLLSQKRKSGGARDNNGYLRFRPLVDYHTDTLEDKSFEENIVDNLRDGKIIIIDLSQGPSNTQSVYSEKISQKIFEDSMKRFIKTQPNNFIQFYFEEAHNLFPKKDDKDLSQIYNRIAKEGAKLNLGMTYATQEPSSISSNILKNTQNWFIAHLNNEDELKEIRKYYDFSDFTDSLVRFSATNDKGFVKMKTYTNPFVVPVQIDRFLANKESK